MAGGPKRIVNFSLSRCQLAADRLAAAAVVDARFALAVWTLTFGPFAVETSVPSDACHPWHWPLSALVTVGAGWCEKPLDQPNDPTLNETAGSCMKKLGSWLSNCTQQNGMRPPPLGRHDATK